MNADCIASMVGAGAGWGFCHAAFCPGRSWPVDRLCLRQVDLWCVFWASPGGFQALSSNALM